MFGKKDAESIQSLLEAHVTTVEESLAKLEEIVSKYRECAARDERLKNLSYELHQIEKKADEARLKTQAAIAEGAFLPFYRHDYLRLTDLIDAIANRAVDFAQYLYLTSENFDAESLASLAALAKAVRASCQPLAGTIHGLFVDPASVETLATAVSSGEQECDSIEWKLIKRIHGEPGIDRPSKIIRARLVRMLSGVADAVENAADHVRVIVVKQSS